MPLPSTSGHRAVPWPRGDSTYVSCYIFSRLGLISGFYSFSQTPKICVLIFLHLPPGTSQGLKQSGLPLARPGHLPPKQSSSWHTQQSIASRMVSVGVSEETHMVQFMSQKFCQTQVFPCCQVGECKVSSSYLPPPSPHGACEAHCLARLQFNLTGRWLAHQQVDRRSRTGLWDPRTPSILLESTSIVLSSFPKLFNAACDPVSSLIPVGRRAGCLKRSTLPSLDDPTPTSPETCYGPLAGF